METKEGGLRMDYMTAYDIWINSGIFDARTKEELLALRGNSGEIEDRFYKELEFGTGGLRGIIGAGTNRMNIYTVRKATQGLCDYIHALSGGEKGVAIAYDSRRFSEQFAQEAACCLCANGIPAYVFSEPRPTPQLSFAVRALGCVAGIVITASHNPAEYNGYKVYWEDGAQITAPRDQQIIAAVRNVAGYDAAKTLQKHEAIASGLYRTLSKEMDDAYIAAIRRLSPGGAAMAALARDLKIVYTPLHGTGAALVGRILGELGFENLFIVPEQARPDGAFPTVAYPNPEEPGVFALAEKLALSVGADIILATDPDADRLGVGVRDRRSGGYTYLDGNMTGALLCDYILARHKRRGTLPGNGAVVSTIVSGKMGRAIAANYGVSYFETLTGFKYIGEMIGRFDRLSSHAYLFGYEESYGYLVGTHARDKDAVSAVMMLCEAAAYYKEKGKTLRDRMSELYAQYGHYREKLVTVTLRGAEGAGRIEKLMAEMRRDPARMLGNARVNRVRDFKAGVIVDMDTGKTQKTQLPAADVLYFELDEEAWCCIRPSGTEPKLKYYFGVRGKNETDAADRLKRLEAAFESARAI